MEKEIYYRRTVSRGFECITEDLTMVSDSESGWGKIIEISRPDNFEKKRESENKPKGLPQISDTFKEDID